MLDGCSITKPSFPRRNGAISKNLSTTIIFSSTPSSMSAFKSEGYYLQSQNLLHRVAPVMSYKGTYYTNVESMDRESQKSKVSPEKCRFYFATNMLWFRDTEHFFTLKLC